MAQGWISLNRELMNHWVWDCEFSAGQAWVDLLLYANHSQVKLMIKGQLIEVNRGQQARSELTLSKAWKWSRNKVRRFLKNLEKDGMIEIKSGHLTTVITICNYDSFQSNDTAGDTSKGQQSKQQKDNTRYTNNNVNNENNENKENSGKQVLPPCPHQEVINIWSEVMSDQRQPRVWDGQRKANLANRWKECFKIMKSDNSGPLYTDKDTGLEFWRSFFIYMRSSDFLINDCKPFGLDWIVNKANFTKIFEGNYHG